MYGSKSFKLVFTGFLLLACLVGAGVRAEESGVARFAATVSDSALPEPALQTYRLIHQGGPFAHEKDGMVFGNRERLLPMQKRGYYREYTVATPGSRDRGARRIVCGGAASRPEVCYYTNDHYASFRRIAP